MILLLVQAVLETTCGLQNFRNVFFFSEFTWLTLAASFAILGNYIMKQMSQQLQKNYNQIVKHALKSHLSDGRIWIHETGQKH